MKASLSPPLSVFALFALFAVCSCSSGPSPSEGLVRPPFGSLASASDAPHPSSHGSPSTPDERRGVHGMVLFGSGPYYISHIPMYSTPHDVQMLAEVTLEGFAGSPALPSSFSDGLHTVQPRPFSLEALRSGRLSDFKGTVFRGNFEGDGVPLAANGTLRVRRILFNETLSTDAPSSPTPRYALLPGGANEASSMGYLVHILEGPPNFDQILRVRFEGQGSSPTARVSPASPEGGGPGMIQGTLVGFTNEPMRRPRTGSRFTFQDATGARRNGVVESELSCLVGPDFVDGCER